MFFHLGCGIFFFLSVCFLDFFLTFALNRDIIFHRRVIFAFFILSKCCVVYFSDCFRIFAHICPVWRRNCDNYPTQPVDFHDREPKRWNLERQWAKFLQNL